MWGASPGRLFSGCLLHTQEARATAMRALEDTLSSAGLSRNKQPILVLVDDNMYYR